MRFLHASAFILGLVFGQSTYACFDKDASKGQPAIELKRFVTGGPYAAYGVEVFPNRTVCFFGFNTRSTRKVETTTISESQYAQALGVFSEVDLTQLASEPQDPMHAVAEVTIVRDGITKSVPFRQISPTFAKVIRNLEQNLGIRDFICPRTEWFDGKLRENGCEIEDRILDDVLSAKK